MRKIITEEMIKNNINHVYSEYDKEHKLFIYVKSTEDRERTEKLFSVMGTLVKKVSSWTEYKILDWKVVLKVNSMISIVR